MQSKNVRMKLSENIYLERRRGVYSYLKDNGIDLAILKDSEGKRNKSIRYLTGHPMDATLILISENLTPEGEGGKAILAPWDINIAEKMANADAFLPSKIYRKSLKELLEEIKIQEEIPYLTNPQKLRKIEISGNFTYPEVYNAIQNNRLEIVCTENGIDHLILNKRMIKDHMEIEILKKAAEITDSVIEEIEKLLKGKINWFSTPKDLTETDLKLFIDKKLREFGGDTTGFETLVASPKRSFSIHTVPAYSSEKLLTPGLALVDFGVEYMGYTSDVTVPIVIEPLTKKQRHILELVLKAYNEAVDMLRASLTIEKLTTRVDNIFESEGFKMPHSLGHGIGLDVHERPLLRKGEKVDTLSSGHVITIEPGLYDPNEGGIRIENDFLITENSYQQLTHSHLITVGN